MKISLSERVWLRTGVMLINGSWGQALGTDWKIFFTTSPILSHKKSDKVLHLIQQKQNEAAVRTLVRWRQVRRTRLRIIEKEQKCHVG